MQSATSPMLHPLLAAHLSEDDDPKLWEIATTSLLDEATKVAANEHVPFFAEVGCCHHWISPHRPIRWTDSGGFAWPFGYNKTVTGWSYRALPEFTWFERLAWTGEIWEPGSTKMRGLVFRMAIPARTARHRKAAIHTIWTPHAPDTPEKLTELFGFQKGASSWELTARKLIPRPRQRGK